MNGVELVPYSPCDHAGFVVGTFAASLSEEFPWRQSSMRPHKRILERVLRDPECRAFVAVPRGHGDDFLGWAASIGGALVYAHVKPIVQRQGVGRTLIDALGISPPVPVIYWTRTCSRLVVEGKPFYFDTVALERLTELVH